MCISYVYLVIYPPVGPGWCWRSQTVQHQHQHQHQSTTPVNNRDLFGHAGPLAGPLLSYIIMEMRDLCDGRELRALFSVCFPLGSDNEVNMNKEGDIF